MSDTVTMLREHARRFRESRGPGLVRAVREASDDALDRLIEWSGSHRRTLAERGPEGAEPAFGVVTRSSIASVWRVYPRQAEGGKVTLLPKAEHYLSPKERERIVSVLEELEPGRKIGPNQRLEIGLSRIAGDASWASYAPLLELAVEVAARGRSTNISLRRT